MRFTPERLRSIADNPAFAGLYEIQALAEALTTEERRVRNVCAQQLLDFAKSVDPELGNDPKIQALLTMATIVEHRIDLGSSPACLAWEKWTSTHEPFVVQHRQGRQCLANGCAGCHRCAAFKLAGSPAL